MSGTRATFGLAAAGIFQHFYILLVSHAQYVANGIVAFGYALLLHLRLYQFALQTYLAYIVALGGFHHHYLAFVQV